MLAAAPTNLTTEPQAAAAAAAAQETSIHLKTIDGSSFTVPFAWIKDSELVNAWYEGLDLKAKTATPVFDVRHVTPYTLELVLQFQEDFADREDYDVDNFRVDEFDSEIKALSNEDLLQVTMAADILQLPRLIRTCAVVMAKRMENKSPEEIKAMFDVDQLMEVDEEEQAEEEAKDDKEEKVDATATTPSA